MVGRLGKVLVASLTVMVTGALSGCSAPQAPIAEAPPPPPVVVIPPEPRPPLGAPAGLRIPPLNSVGLRQTVNLGVSPGQAIWNFRSAYNVAALDCMQAEHTAILDNYKLFLKTFAKRLTSANKEVDKGFGTAKGKPYIRLREAYMTQVYNFYALPPTLPAFCDAVLAMSNDLKTVPAKGLDDFVVATLPKLDRPFLDFFNSYDQYRTDLSAWQQRYAPTQAAPAPMVSSASPAVLPSSQIATGTTGRP